MQLGTVDHSTYVIVEVDVLAEGQHLPNKRLLVLERGLLKP